MANPNLCSSYIIRVCNADSASKIKVQNIKTSESFEFESFQSLKEFLEARAYPKGLR